MHPLLYLLVSNRALAILAKCIGVAAFAALYLQKSGSLNCYSSAIARGDNLSGGDPAVSIGLRGGGSGTLINPPVADPEDCATFTPECEPEDAVATRWGADVLKDYNQTQCCLTLGYLRTAVPQVFAALEENNLTSWLEGGSALGVARHDGGQIPWDYDADINFLYGTDSDELFVDLPPPVRIRTEGDRDSLGDRIVQTLNRNNRQEGTEWAWNWACRQRKWVKYCVKIQLEKRALAADGTHAGKLLHVDLFGIKRHMAPKLVDGVARASVNYPGCYRNPAMEDEHSYHMIPPTRCRFYDTDVWCPRDIVGYLEGYYGKAVMSKGMM